MLPKINRLKKTKDIESVFKKGEGYREGVLFLKFAKNNLGFSRFAFIISKKIAKKAVTRNKIKRILREAVGARLLEIKTGFDVVIVVQGGATKSPEKEFGSLVVKLFKKTKLI